ncbi:MAG: Jag N-terminal domain-containing protein [Thermoanaerobaculia bacterium]|nr:Jag N-terminal domain-containing protein [Thermoanaerobaculia bacterium]
MSAKRFEGKNLEEALDNAASSFGVERFRVSYHVVLEKRGFLGGTKRVVIEAEVSDAPLPEVETSSPESGKKHESGKKKEQKQARPERAEKKKSQERTDRKDQRSSETPSEDQEGRERRGRSRRNRGGRGRRGKRDRDDSRPERKKETVAPAEIPEQGSQSEDAAKIAHWCDEVFRLSGLDLVARTTDRDEEIEVELYGSDVPMVSDEAADFIDSLQVLANKTFTGRQIERRVEIDAGGFKKRREEDLGERARELADRVRSEGRERTMRAMTPIERRIVHVTLEPEEGVTTESRGRGFHKRVVIVPEEDERAVASDQ